MAGMDRTSTDRQRWDDTWRAAVDSLEATLTDAQLADRVEMVVSRVGEDRYRAAAVDGSVEFTRDRSGDRPRYAVAGVEGRNPLGVLSPDHLAGHAEERRARFPDRTVNAYPHAHDSIAQFFDAPHAPDLVALHTAAHHTDGHLGQHGSLGVVQARAPFLAAGAGVRSLGMVDRAARVVDVAPTVAALLGVAPHPEGVGPTGRPRPDALLRRQDGDPETALLDGTVAEHVVVLLLDGCNANLLYDVIGAGEAPHLAALLGRGTAYRHGAMASLPTATLANHTTAVTGAHPGHSGVLHNTWVDSADGSVPDLLAMDQMFWAMRHLSPDVETVFQAVERTRPGAFTSATFEFCDTGASFSSFGLVRDGQDGSGLPPLEAVTHLDRPSAEASAAYRFMASVDHLSAAHTIECWEQVHGNPLPTLSWCSLALTDEAGHESGPHGELARAAVRDSDARVGDVLAAVERAGALERTAVLVIADHGMEQNDPAVDAPWTAALDASGVPHREVGGGLIYLT
jgi:phosphonoacetate hydrolase